MAFSPDVSVLIVSFQVRDLLRDCLKSLSALGQSPRLEIFVVDNASNDGTGDLLRQEFPSVHLIANAENKGFAAANNQALGQAAGRYFLLLNPDTLVPNSRPNPLETLIHFMDATPRAAACGPMLKYADGTFQQSAFEFPTLAQVLFDLFPPYWRLAESSLNGRYPRHKYLSGRPFQIGHPLGAALLMRREAVDQVGLLDEDFFIYVEEVDWCLRARKLGWEVWCVPSAEITHLEARSTSQFRDKMFVELWRSRIHYFRKHKGKTYNALVTMIVRLGLSKASATTRSSFERKQISPSELQRRLDAYSQVVQLTRAYAQTQTRA